MNGLLTHSNLSFESVESVVPRPPSILSFATYTSTNTVDVPVGIGTLSGRMIYAFGEVALRGVENLAIRRRLAKSISAFPHEDDDIIKDIERIYDHAFELSRYFIEFSANQVSSQAQFIIQVWSLSCASPKASIASTAYPDRNTADSPTATKSGEMAVH